MKNAEYWKKRFSAVETRMNGIGRSAVDEVAPAFDRAERQIQKEINNWYQRFAKNNNVSLADARKMLDAKELEELKWDVNDYIRYGHDNAVDPRWMKQLENASAKTHISRLEALQIRTQQAAEAAFGTEHSVLTDCVKGIYTDDYYHTAYEIQKGVGVGWDIGEVDNNRLDKLIQKPWTADRTTFSDKIWTQKDKLVSSVHTELTQMCVLGKAPDEAIKNISKLCQGNKKQAGRLVMTESAYFASQAQKDCFAELEVEEYEIVATLDSQTSEICQEMDGKHFPMSQFEAGVTAPPFHPWCRSTTVPYFDDEWGRQGTRAARGDDGKTYQVPADMKYADWKNKFVDGEFPVDAPISVEHKNTFDFLPAKTIDEAENFISKYVNDGAFGALGVSYQGVSVDVANEINKTIGEFFETFDVEKFGGIIAPKANSKLGKMIENATAAYSPVRNSFILNRNSLKTMEIAKKAFNAEAEALDNFLKHPERYDFDKLSKTVKGVIERSKTSGRATVPTNISDAINHELGHMLEKKVFADDLWGDVEENIIQYADKVSGYAGTNRSEYVAESLASYLKGEDVIDPNLKKIFERLRR